MGKIDIKEKSEKESKEEEIHQIGRQGSVPFSALLVLNQRGKI